MKIGIDIDDTITDIQGELLNKALEYDKSLRNTGIIYPERKYIGQRFDWSNEEKEYFLGKIRWNVMDNARLRDGVIESLTLLKEEGHEIVFITARSDRYVEEPYSKTYNWLKKNNIPFDKLIVNALNKGNVCKEEKIDVFIDDQENNCNLTYDFGIKTIFFNINNNEIKNDYIVAYNWVDIFNKIHEK